MSRHRRRPDRGGLRQRLSTRVRYANAEHRIHRRLLTVIGGLALLGVAWVLVTSLLVRGEAQRLQVSIQQVRHHLAQGDLASAKRVATSIPAQADRVHDFTTGPAWWLAAQVPYLGDPVDVVRDMAAAADKVGSEAVPLLLDLAEQLDPAKLRVTGDTIALAPLTAAVPKLHATVAAIHDAEEIVNDSPRSWFRPVKGYADTFRSELRRLAGHAEAADRAVQLLPTMLGGSRPHRYFVVLQNEAEMRGTGGLPGVFAIAVANKGRLSFTRFANDGDMPFARKPADYGPGYRAAYGSAQPTQHFLNSNMSPHFPYAAQTWARMWRLATGDQIDGAIAVDPTALAFFLDVLGPVAMPNGVTLTSDNVVSLTQRDQYVYIPDVTQRKQFVVDVFKAATARLLSGAGRPEKLARAFVQASTDQRVLVWSADPAAQKLLEETSYAGALPDPARPLAAPTVNNVTGTKLEYFLARSLKYQRTGCGAVRDVIATITLANTAPPTWLPPYVTTRLDKPNAPVRRGDNKILLDYFTGAGTVLESAAVDGKLTTAGVQEVLGHMIYRLHLDLPRGATRVIELHLSEPAGQGPPVIWRQPGVNPLYVTAYDQPCD